MISVIKHGRLDKPPVIYRFICWHCGCVYEADSKDSGVGHHVGGMGHLYAHCNCPDCGYTNTLDTEGENNET